MKKYRVNHVYYENKLNNYLNNAQDLPYYESTLEKKQAMIPIMGCYECLYPVPGFEPGKSDIVDHMYELRGFHMQLAYFFNAVNQ